MNKNLPNISLSSSDDAHIEINGIKIAAIQSYKIISRNNLKSFSFSQANDEKPFFVTFSKIQTLNSNLNFEFSVLSDFNLAIVKPKHQIIFCGCNWVNITESTSLEKPTIQYFSLSATQKTTLKL